MLSYNTPPKGGGLYLIRLSDTHFYGGRARSFKVRWRQHLKALQEGSHENPHMQNVFLAHGRFEPQVLAKLKTCAERIPAEQKWLDEHINAPGCVNINPFATGGLPSGLVWATDGTENKRVAPDKIPEGWGPGRSGKSTKGYIWVTDGHENRKCPPNEIPGGFREGKSGPVRNLWVHRFAEDKKTRKRVSKAELPTYLAEGWSEGPGATRKMAWIHRDGEKKRVPLGELPTYLAGGWERGTGVSTQGKRVWVHREGEQRRVRPSEVAGFLEEGWREGQARFASTDLIWIRRGEEEKKRVPLDEFPTHEAGGWERGFGEASEKRKEKLRQRWVQGAYADR
jgi:hypothetical protein